MNQCLKTFPPETWEQFDHIAKDGGLLKAEICEKLCIDLDLSIESLMLQLLPLAAEYSVAPISSYLVGAIVLGCNKNSAGWSNLYFGANIEFDGQALTHSVHAEQAAIANAWLHGETTVSKLAVSAAPCGHCRQFLHEVVGNVKLPILIPADPKTNNFINNEGKVKSLDLATLLPDAFSPSDLGCNMLMMQASDPQINLKLENQTDDHLINLALETAQLSYAPYTHNYSGCVIQLSNGDIFAGRYAENVAYNPSLLAFSAAYSQLLLNGNNVSDIIIERIVLAEQATKTSQKQITQLLIADSCLNVELEYFSLRQY